MTKIQDIIVTLQEELPKWGATLVRAHLDQTKPYNSSFAEDLDNPHHHKPQWHQWGILTHTNKVLEAFIEEVPTYLEAWELTSSYIGWSSTCYLNNRSSQHTKKDLMCIAIILHDLGKFTNRHLSIKQSTHQSALPDFSFGLHEVSSEQIIHSDLVYPTLVSLGLASEEIYYIGRVAALHYELGKIRERAKKDMLGFSAEYIMSDNYQKECNLLLRSHLPFAMELGLIYLADNLGKTSFRMSTQESLTPSTVNTARQHIEHKNLDPRHIHAVTNFHVGILATKRYFSNWVKLQRTLDT